VRAAVFESFDVERNHTFGHSRIQPILAFRDLIHNKIPEQFPKLNWLYQLAGWVPFMRHVSSGCSKKSRSFLGPRHVREYRTFVAAEADEDIKYIRVTGEDHLIIGWTMVIRSVRGTPVGCRTRRCRRHHE
jgi:hypothetical protein